MLLLTATKRRPQVRLEGPQVRLVQANVDGYLESHRGGLGFFDHLRKRRAERKL